MNLKRPEVVLLSVLLFASLPATGCKKRADEVASNSEETTVVVPTNRSATPTSSSAPTAGSPAGELFRSRPAILVRLSNSQDWSGRVWAYVRGDTSDQSCPGVATATGADEFAVREAKRSALAKCKPDNDRALAYMKSCPVLAQAEVEIGKYDFDRKVFPVTITKGWNSLLPGTWSVAVAAPGQAFVEPGFALSWSGLPSVADPTLSERCAHSLLDGMPAATSLRLELPADESRAKKLHDQWKTTHEDHTAFDVLQYAYLIDGAVARVQFPCAVVKDNIPTGRVLAWRLGIRARPRVWLTDWTSVGTFSPPASCDEAQKFFDPNGETQREEASLAAQECACPLVRKWEQFGWFVSWETDEDFSPIEGPLTGDRLAKKRAAQARKKAKLDRLVEETNRRAGCESDKTAKTSMLAALKQLQRMMDRWSALFDKSEVSVSQLASLGRESDVLDRRMTRLVDPYCKGPDCWFGCGVNQR